MLFRSPAGLPVPACGRVRPGGRVRLSTGPVPEEACRGPVEVPAPERPPRAPASVSVGPPACCGRPGPGSGSARSGSAGRGRSAGRRRPVPPVRPVPAADDPGRERRAVRNRARPSGRGRLESGSGSSGSSESCPPIGCTGGPPTLLRSRWHEDRGGANLGWVRAPRRPAVVGRRGSRGPHSGGWSSRHAVGELLTPEACRPRCAPRGRPRREGPKRSGSSTRSGTRHPFGTPTRTDSYSAYTPFGPARSAP